MADGVCNFPLDRGQRTGLGITAAFGLVSALAIIWLLSSAARNAISNYRKPQGFKLIRTHVDVYFLSLLIADLIQSLGAMFNLKWVVEGHTYCSTHCTAQGAIKEIGESGVALTTLLIALHTFFAIFFHWVPPRTRWFSVGAISSIWGFLIIFVAVNMAKHPFRPGGAEPYYAPSPFWCWVSKGYTTQRITGEYAWLWACAFVSIVLYVPLYFCLRGNIRVDPSAWYRITFRRRRDNDDEGVHIRGVTARQEATKMLVYPITYTILVLPLSIGRWATFTNVERPSNGANYDAEAARHSSNKTYLIILIGICIFGLSGVANVILFMVTRPKLLSLNGSQDPSTPSISTHAGAHLGPRSSVVYGSRRKSLIPPRSHHDPADTKSSHIGDVVVLDTFTPRSGSFTEEERDRKSPHRGTEHDLSPSLYESSRTRTPSRKMFSRAAISSRPPSPTLSDDDEERPSDRRVDMLTFLKNEGRKRTPEGAAPTYPPPAIVASGPTFTGPPVMTPRTPAAVNVEVTVERSYM